MGEFLCIYLAKPKKVVEDFLMTLLDTKVEMWGDTKKTIKLPCRKYTFKSRIKPEHQQMKEKEIN